MFLSRGGVIRPCRGANDARFRIPLAVFCNFAARCCESRRTRFAARVSRRKRTRAPGLSRTRRARARRLQVVAPLRFRSRARRARRPRVTDRRALAPQSDAVLQPSATRHETHRPLAAAGRRAVARGAPVARRLRQQLRRRAGRRAGAGPAQHPGAAAAGAAHAARHGAHARAVPVRDQRADVLGRRRTAGRLPRGLASAPR